MGNLPHRKVVNVILTARTPRGELALVVFHDGQYGITRDEQALPEHFWNPDQLDDCVEAFMKLSQDQRE